jgi:hypothetical protein
MRVLELPGNARNPLALLCLKRLSMGYRSQGAGGTPGGAGHFLVGLIMACTGFYLLLDNIVVSHGFHMGYALYRVPFAGSWNITGGGLLIPFMFGVGWIFYNARAPWGWILAAGSLAAIVLGVLMSLSITLQTMSLLNLIIILVLTVGGLGLFARSLRAS